MLVLSRRQKESIKIGNDVEVCVFEIRGDKVRLAIDAPEIIPVHRSEVYDAIVRQGGMIPSVVRGGIVDDLMQKVGDIPEPYRSRVMLAVREVLS